MATTKKSNKKEKNKGKRIIAILPDNGERYLSVDWLFE